MKTHMDDPERTARAWLAFSDAGKFEASWQATATHFRSQLTQADWVSRLNAARSPLGPASSRVLKSSQTVTDLPDGPPGEYVVMEFETVFSSGAAHGERITTIKDNDGVLRVVGYYLV
ncbi:MAG: DUF4019 domain-containing protein [Burkholderiaceae bacterium]